LHVGKPKLASGSCVPEAKGNAGMQAIVRNKLYDGNNAIEIYVEK
jgi:hypothetical protein